MSDLFPGRPTVDPRIYAYSETNPDLAGQLKIGFTTKEVQHRVAEQFPVLKPGPLPYKIVLDESAMRPDGTAFRDTDVHKVLRYRGFENTNGEWFRCSANDVKAVILAVRDGQEYEKSRTRNFGMRPEQEAAVAKTAAYLKEQATENRHKAARFLWNAKMRFGKTFTAYQLAKRMGWKKVLVLTFKPAVQNAWEEDLTTHVDFEGWQFISPDGLSYEEADKSKPFVCFGSFQDYLGKNSQTGGIKTKNVWVHAINWDCVILDEYHFGAWRDSVNELFEGEEQPELDYQTEDGQEYFDEAIVPITTSAYLYLSGTPFRALASGEFIEEQIYNWTYTDEQRAKAEWSGPANPYQSLPRMVLMTYRMPEALRDIAHKGQFDSFDLNAFFSTTGTGGKARFSYQEQVQKWLDLIRGAYAPTTVDNLRLGAQRPPMPFSDSRLLEALSHTFWFLPTVASCHAMRNLLTSPQNKFFHDFKVIIAAGIEAGIGTAALKPVLEAMEDPLRTRTITLSCGKLTTGVTVRPWTGIFILRNSSSPETYFQAAFRVQSPWTICNPEGLTPNEETVLKEECYVFDFAPDRALKLISEYSCRLSVDESSPEAKVKEFINFLPVLAYDGSAMEQINASQVLDMAMSGTTATLLARRWQSALLVNVDNDTLKRLLADEDAMKAIMSIEGFRSLNADIQTIINKSEAVSKAKREANDGKLTPKEKAELTKEEKEYKSKRKEIQEKLIKFATRVPVFMYLTDFRELTLKQVITQVEPDLFKRVTGLTVRDFELLLSLGLFSSSVMNEAVYNFKRYEDSSLNYTGINRHKDQDIGLFDTTIKASEARIIYEVGPDYDANKQDSSFAE